MMYPEDGAPYLMLYQRGFIAYKYEFAGQELNAGIE